VLRENFGDLVFDTVVRKTIKFAEAPVYRNLGPQVRFQGQGGRIVPRPRAEVLNADRPSMKDGLSELFRRTDSGGAIPEARAGRSSQRAAVRDDIKVVGIGGAGTNAVNRMVDSAVKGVEFIAVNTDVQQLDVCDADVKIHIGQEITHGLGGGRQPRGEAASHGGEPRPSSRRLRGADLVFSRAGEGAAPAPAALRRRPDRGASSGRRHHRHRHSR